LKKKYVNQLEVGDTISIPHSLQVSSAKIVGGRKVPTKAGDVYILELESNGNLWSSSKSTIAFHGNEKVECKPLRKPLWEKVKAFFRFFDFTR
jgi:hypothetical protein